MALNFKEIGQKATNDSELMATRQKVKCKEVIAKYPEGITINAIDFVNMTDKKSKEKKDVAVFGFAEDSGKYFFGGIAISFHLCATTMFIILFSFMFCGFPQRFDIFLIYGCQKVPRIESQIKFLRN